MSLLSDRKYQNRQVIDATAYHSLADDGVGVAAVHLGNNHSGMPVVTWMILEHQG